MRKDSKYLFFVGGIYLLLVSFCISSKGMFLDGTFYAAIAKNLAAGKGSFWDLHFSLTKDPHFMSHPPLVFAILAFLYKIFGYSFVVEKIYSATTFLFAGFFIVRIWDLLDESTEKTTSWLPLFIMLLFPVTIWAAQNNLLDNTMVVFDLAAIYFIFKSKTKTFLHSLFAGLMLFLAFMSKGLPALYPLSLPIFLIFFHKEFNLSKLIKIFTGLGLGLIVPFALIFSFNKDAIIFFETYFNHQILKSIDKKTHRFFNYDIIIFLLQETAIPLIISILSLILQKNKNYDKKNIFTLFMLGLSGVLPILLSWKQRRFYLIAVLPVFALMFGFFLKDYAKKIVEKLNLLKFDILKITTFVLFFSAFLIIIKNYNKICRDKALLTDISEISTITNENKILSVTTKTYTNWALQAYLMRFYDISLTTKDTCRFFISEKTEIIKNTDYKPIEQNLNLLKIYERKK